MIFWLPAVLTALFCRSAIAPPFFNAVASVFVNDASVSGLAETLPVILQFFFAFFMLMGWGVTTSTAAYHFPRRTLSFMLAYTGLNLLATMAFYMAEYDTLPYYFLRDYAGILSYLPLAIIVKALDGFNIYREVFVLFLVTFSCAVGYIVGLLHRRINPSPYRPRIG